MVFGPAWPVKCQYNGMRRKRNKALHITDTTPLPDAVAKVKSEEPLPIVMGEMALWGAAMSALMIPISIIGILASPVIAAGNLFRREPVSA